MSNYLDDLQKPHGDRDLPERYAIEMIAPRRRARRSRTQGGRPLRRYRKCGRVERLFASFHHLRWLVIRLEYHVEHFSGMVHLVACKFCPAIYQDRKLNSMARASFKSVSARGLTPEQMTRRICASIVPQ
jgi:hypothetical protein